MPPRRIGIARRDRTFPRVVQDDDGDLELHGDRAQRRDHAAQRGVVVLGRGMQLRERIDNQHVRLMFTQRTRSACIADVSLTNPVSVSTSSSVPTPTGPVRMILLADIGRLRR